MESFGRPAPSRGREALAADAASRKRVRLTEERIIDRDEERLRRALSQLEGRKASLREDRRQFEEQQEAKENYVAEEIEKTKLLLAISVGRRTTRANNERLDELPQEIWEKVFDKLGEHDLFPLALSCRYFRQKQKDLVARKSELRMRTVFKMNQGSRSNRSLSSDYIRFAYASALNTPLADLQGASAERDMALQDAQIFFMWIAKSRGDYDLIKALGWSEMNPELNTLLVDVWSQGAALRNNLDLLKFLHENRLTRRSWGASCTAKAASRGRLEILEYAKEKGIPLWEPEELDRWDPCAYAAFGGKLKVLQWLRSNGCPWNSRTCENAARLGRFKTLCWALENGCPWDVEECYRTADHEIKEWIDSTGRTLYAGQAVLGALQNLQ